MYAVPGQKRQQAYLQNVCLGRPFEPSLSPSSWPAPLQHDPVSPARRLTCGPPALLHDPRTPFLSDALTPCAHQSPMLAAQVNARKHDNLRMTLGFGWVGGLGLCEALLGVGCWSRLQSLMAVLSGDSGPKIPPPPIACWRELLAPPCVVFGSVVRWMLAVLQSCSVLLLGR